MRLIDSELYDLAIALADSAARSDVECLCACDPVGRAYKLQAVFDNEPECVAIVARAARYIELREASGEPMPYKVIREGDKVRFE